MGRIRVRWEVPHNSEGHRIVVGGRIRFVIVIPRGRLPSNMADVSRRVARGRVHSIALDGKLYVGSHSIKHGCVRVQC
jgi:hypothetical protein